MGTKSKWQKPRAGWTGGPLWTYFFLHGFRACGPFPSKNLEYKREILKDMARTLCAFPIAFGAKLPIEYLFFFPKLSWFVLKLQAPKNLYSFLPSSKWQKPWSSSNFKLLQTKMNHPFFPLEDFSGSSPTKCLHFPLIYPALQSRDKDGCTPNVRVPMVFIVFSRDSWGF